MTDIAKKTNGLSGVTLEACTCVCSPVLLLVSAHCCTKYSRKKISANGLLCHYRVGTLIVRRVLIAVIETAIKNNEKRA